MAYNSPNLSSKMPVTGPKSSHSSGGLWLLQTSPTRSPNHLAINEHRLTTDNCSDHFPREPTTEVRADPAAGLKVLRVKRPLFLGIHDRQIRIGTDGDRAFAWIQPEELRRGRCGEMGYAFERQAARVHALGHENRQCRLNAGDAAPGLPNILVSPGLVGGRAGSMIRADQVDAPRAHALDHLVALGVHADECVEPGSSLESDGEHAVGDALEIVDPAVAHERFEADDTAVVKALELREVFGDHASPQPEIDECLLRCDGAFRIERCDGGRGRVRVEGHLEHRRHAAGRCAARAGFPAFPVCSPRLVEVDVCIYHARKAHDAACIHAVAVVMDLGADCRDDAVMNRDVNATLAGGEHRGTPTDDERVSGHTTHRNSSIVISCAPSQSVSLPISGSCSRPSITVAK